MIENIIQGIIIGAVGGAFAGLSVYTAKIIHQKLIDRRDAKTVHKWVVEKTGIQDHLLLGTMEIASHCNLPEERVKFICSHHPDIYLWTGAGKDERWTLNRAKAEESYRVGVSVQ